LKTVKEQFPRGFLMFTDWEWNINAMSKRVEVYLNRRAMGKSRKRVYSIRDAKTHVVWTTNSTVLLENVELVVQPRGRQDTLERLSSNQKISRTVHAFLRGDLIRRGRQAARYAEPYLGTTPLPVGYDPIKTDSWVVLSGFQMPDTVEAQPRICQADCALLHADGIVVPATFTTSPKSLPLSHRER
jgi:hypothetical protein